MITNNEINKYIKDIKKHLLYGTKESKHFLRTLKQNITDYVAENQNADMAQVTEQFGKPEDIAATFFEQYGEADIKKRINIRRVVVAAAVVTISMIAFALIIALIDSHIDTENYERYIIEEGTTYVLTDTNSAGIQT